MTWGDRSKIKPKWSHCRFEGRWLIALVREDVIIVNCYWRKQQLIDTSECIIAAAVILEVMDTFHRCLLLPVDQLDGCADDRCCYCATAVTVNVIATPLVCETNGAINVCVHTLDGILRMLNKLSISLSLYQLKGREDECISWYCCGRLCLLVLAWLPMMTAIAQVKNTVMFVFQAWKVSGIVNDWKLSELELSLNHYLSLPSRKNDEYVG